MAILYGTTGDGTTLPVLVDQFGNLLAKGIDGQPGTPGTPGEPGPPGPPGVGELPPDPYEGAFLCWLNNELAWIGTPPIPVPEGRFGPITYWDSAGLLTVEGEIPSQIKQGVFVYQCNEDGSIYVDGWNNSQIWSDSVAFSDTYVPVREPTKAFDNELNSNVYCYPTAGNYAKYVINQTKVTSLRVNAGKSAGGGWGEFKINQGLTTEADITGLPSPENADAVWIDLTSQIPNSGQITNIYTKSTATQGSGLSSNVARIAGIEVNGALLVDSGEYPTALNLNFRVQSVSGQNLIGVANRTDNFSIGKFLRVPEQNVARWLYDGNLNKVITSTGIDISRLTEN